MKLENLASNSSKVENGKYYNLVDLTFLSASPLYGSGDVQLPGGKFLPRPNSSINPNSDFYKGPESIPKYSTPSKLFLENDSIPLLRYDPADEGHEEGHLHVRDGPALPNITGEEARRIYMKALLRKWQDEDDE